MENEERLSLLEKDLGPFEKWDVSSFAKLFEKKELLDAFSPQLAGWLIANRKNEEVYPILNAIYIGDRFMSAKKESQDLAKQYADSKLTKEEFRKKVSEMAESPNLDLRMFAYLIILSSDYDPAEISAEIARDKVLSDISQYEDQIMVFDAAEGMDVVISMLDVLTYLREQYYEIYKEDIVPMDDRLNKIFSDLNDVAKKSLEEMVASGKAPKGSDVDVKFPELGKKDEAPEADPPTSEDKPEGGDI